MTTRLRPPAERRAPGTPVVVRDDQSLPPRHESAGRAWPAWSTRAVPLRALLFVAVLVLVGLAVWRPGAPAAVVGVPIALLVPGVIVTKRYLRDPDRAITVWAQRLAVSIGWWVVVGAGVALGRVPVFSGWTVVVGAVLAAAVLFSDSGAHWGTVSVRAALSGVVVLGLAVGVCFGARGLAWLGGTARSAGGPVALAFVDPDVPVALSPTGAQASVRLVLINRGTTAVRETVTVQVGAGLPWTSDTIEVSAGQRTTVTMSGGVLVCREAQQLGVSVDPASPPVLTALIPGAIDAAACPTG